MKNAQKERSNKNSSIVLHTCKPSIILRSLRKTFAEDGTLRGVRAADNQARVCLLIMAFLLNMAAT